MSQESGDPSFASVVIPSHNRVERLRRTLLALAPQLRQLADVDVVVCADGCQDDTVAMARSFTDLPISVVELPGVGPAGARNAGAAAARGSLLIFLDDDVEPAPGFVAAHLEAHRSRPGCIVLGPYPPAPFPSRSRFRLEIRRWWDRHFEALAEPGHRICYKDILTGNLSLSKAIWTEVGEFDPELRAHEDYEFGIRAIEADVPVVFEPRALGYHYEQDTMQIERLFRRAREEGRADVAIARRHSQIAHELTAVRLPLKSPILIHFLYLTIFAAGKRGDGGAGRMAGLLPWLDRRQLRGRYSKLLKKLLSYWYLRGAADCFSSVSDWKSFARNLADRPQEPALAIDLGEGLEAGEDALERARPKRAMLLFKNRPLGELPFSAAAERWSSHHLRPFLIRELGPEYLRALAADGLIYQLGRDGRKRLDGALARMAPHYGRRKCPDVWMEQAEQWHVV